MAVDANTTTTSIGLEENVASAVAYAFGVISGAVVFLLESENRHVRFHGAQSMVLAVAVFGLAIALGFAGLAVNILLTGWLDLIVGLVFTVGWFGVLLGGFVMWLYLIVRTFQGANPRIPVVAGIADSLVN